MEHTSPHPIDFQAAVKVIVKAAAFVESAMLNMKQVSPAATAFVQYQELERMKKKLMDTAQSLSQVHL